MKHRLLKLVAVGVFGVAVVGMGGCDDSTQTSFPANDQDSKPVYMDQSAVNSAKSAWPHLEEAEQVSIAENVLTSNYYVILDGSGSMDSRRCAAGETKMTVAKKALAVFSKSLPNGANLGMLAFDGNGVSERLPLGSKNREAFIESVNQVYAKSGTPLKKALTQAFQKLTEQGKRQLGYGEYHMVVVTDGEASSGEDPKRVVNDIYQDSPVILHTIGFCIDEEHSLNQPGKAYYKAANNPRALQSGLDNVLAELDSFNINEFN